MAADCKSAGGSLRWFKSTRYHHFFGADLAQQVEHIHGKDGVPGPTPGVGSISLVNIGQEGRKLR